MDDPTLDEQLRHLWQHNLDTPAPGSSRRWRAPLAAAALVAVGVVALALVGVGDTPRDVATGPASRPVDDNGPSASADIDAEVPLFEVLAVTTTSDDPPGTLRAATNESELDELWARAMATSDSGSASPPASADLDTHLVVSITRADGLCPTDPELVGFERNGDTFTPQFEREAEQCRYRLVPKTWVVALDRSALPNPFTLRNPAEQSHFDEQRLTVRDAKSTGHNDEPTGAADSQGPSEEEIAAADARLEEQLDSGWVPYGGGRISDPTDHVEGYWMNVSADFFDGEAPLPTPENDGAVPVYDDIEGEVVGYHYSNLGFATLAEVSAEGFDPSALRKDRYGCDAYSTDPGETC